MISNASFWLLLSLPILVSTAVHGQAACPAGTIPYGTGQDQNVCGPDDNRQPSQQQPTPPQWVSRWGAIATALPQGVMGFSTNLRSDADATHVALSDCRSKGGTNCKIELSYGNQCIAMAVGNPGYSVDLGLTSTAASEKSLKDCTNGGAANCHIIYSACSLPVRIR
jgi:hypothetical protein